MFLSVPKQKEEKNLKKEKKTGHAHAKQQSHDTTTDKDPEGMKGERVLRSTLVSRGDIRITLCSSKFTITSYQPTCCNVKS